MSKSTIKRVYHKVYTIGKPQKHIKSLYSPGSTLYGQTSMFRQRSACTRIMGREEPGEGKELFMIRSSPPHL